MYKKAAIGFLVGAFLVGAWGNLIAAAFCPRFLSDRDCSIQHLVSQPKPAQHQPSCHQTMDNAAMQMERKASASAAEHSNHALATRLTAPSSTNQAAFELPTDKCAHCWNHSQPTSGTAYTAALDSSQRSIDRDFPQANFNHTSVASPISIIPLEHGPPGISLPRHVLINVFRI